MRDGEIYDGVPSASERYVEGKIAPRRDLTMWGHNFPAQTVEAGTTLRLIAGDAFRVRWTSDSWKNYRDFKATETKMGLFYADITVPKKRGGFGVDFFLSGRDEMGRREF